MINKIINDKTKFILAALLMLFASKTVMLTAAPCLMNDAMHVEDSVSDALAELALHHLMDMSQTSSETEVCSMSDCIPLALPELLIETAIQRIPQFVNISQLTVEVSPTLKSLYRPPILS